MREARVLVVDDSAAMRALFSDVLDQSQNVRVIGTAASADEARAQIVELKPNVITLDVEMPGMSGIEFLEEIMGKAPMPVVMLSSLTQAGSETSLRALELGAIECFPKPLKATPEQFAKTVGKLGKIVLAAANSNVADRPRTRTASAAPATAAAPFDWNGNVVAMSAAMGGVDACSALLAGWPANCPPTIVVLQTEQAIAEAFVKRLSGELRCQVAAVADGAELRQGTVHITADPTQHVIVEAGQPPRLKLMARDPVEGARPSANLLFGTLARGGVPVVAAMLTGHGADGAKGLKIMRDGGFETFVQTPASALVAEAPEAAIALGAAKHQLALEEIGAAMLAACAK